MQVRAKFRLTSVTHNEGASRTFKFVAVFDDGTEENRKFFDATPWGEFTMIVNNPAVFEAFQLGDEYYADFTPANK